MELIELERSILNLLLAGDNASLALLRTQLEAVTVASREFTGPAFFTQFELSGHTEGVPGRPSLVIGDVYAKIKGLAYGAGFLLFVRDGVLSCLEGYCYGDDGWPREQELVEAYYVHHEPPDSPMLKRCVVRDLSQLCKIAGL